MNVSVIVVTRGDVDLGSVMDSFPDEWERVVWDNGCPCVTIYENEDDWRGDGPAHPYERADMSVYGRYAAIKHATHDLIYVQDDDVIVSDPQAIVDAWLVSAPLRTDHLVANMPPEFRHVGYTDSCLVGFGACFHRDAPARAFERAGFDGKMSPFIEEDGWTEYVYRRSGMEIFYPEPLFVRRTCDVLFSALTPRVLVDVPIQHLPHAHDDNRMWKQPGHVEERTRMLELARAVRDA